jgi:two-component system sensor histidine kinase RpfC
MSGPDIVKLFRAGSAGRARLPIIMLSADATPAAKQQSIDAGADEFVTKPVTAPLLLGAIERVMQGIEARSQAKWIGEASETPSRSAPVMVDPERISSLRRIARGDEIFLAKYLSAAFAEIEKAISDLRQAVAMHDVEAARDAMHIIEGTGSSIGAVALVANCKSARGFVHVRNDPDSAAAIAELSSVYALTKSAVKATIHDYAAHSRTRSTGA